MSHVPGTSISHLDVYGQDHSPWVQGVLLGLHEKGIPHTLVMAPPLNVFKRWAVKMPAVSVDRGPWQSDSAKILQQLGYETISREDYQALYNVWHGVTHRAAKTGKFFHSISLIRDHDSHRIRRLGNHFALAFIALYFYLQLQIAKLLHMYPDPKNFADQFCYWERKLEVGEGIYLGGDEPSVLDIMLFGMIQCHSSIPGPPLHALKSDARLVHIRSWIAAMHNRFAGYPHLYSGVYFEPYSPGPQQSTSRERILFWLSLVLLILAFPITCLLLAYCATRSYWN